MENHEDKNEEKANYLEVIAKLINVIIILLIVIVILIVINFTGLPSFKENKEIKIMPPVKTAETEIKSDVWLSPDTNSISKEANACGRLSRDQNCRWL